MTFDPRPLKVTGLYAELEVIPYDGNIIVVSIDGTEADIKTIVAKESGAYLVLSGGQSGGIGGGNIGISFSRTTKRTGFNNIVSSILGMDNSTLSIQNIISGSFGNVGPKVTVKVPFKTDITLSELNGAVTIGDTLGNLNVTIDSDDDVAVGSVLNVTAEIADDGDLSIAEINGNLNIIVDGDGDTNIGLVNGNVVAKIRDDGDITIGDGTITLDLYSNGGGDFVFSGISTQTSLLLNDDGEISIKEIRGTSVIKSNGDADMTIKTDNGTLSVTISDDGDISIGSGTIDSLTFVGSGSYGEFQFGGVASECTIKSDGDGDINISQANGNLNVNLSGDGDCNIKRGEVTNLVAKVTDDGSFDFGGNAVNADLKVTSYGDIDVRFVKNRPYTSNKGDGDITVGNWDD